MIKEEYEQVCYIWGENISLWLCSYSFYISYIVYYAGTVDVIVIIE